MKMVSYIMIIVFFVGSTFNSFCISKNQSSIVEHDTEKSYSNIVRLIDTLHQFSSESFNIELELHKCIIHYKKNESKTKQIKSIGYLAYYFEVNNVLDSSKYYYSKAENIITSVDESELDLWLQLKKVGLYRKQGNYSQAILKLDELLKTNQSKRDKIRLLNTLGYFYKLIGDSQKSVKYFSDAITLSKDINDARLQAILYNNMGNSYALAQDFVMAKEYFSKGIEAFGEDSITVPILYNNLAKVYEQLGDEQKALEFYYKCLENIPERAHDNFAEVNINIGSIWLNRNQLDSAAYYGNTAFKHTMIIGENSLEYIHTIFLLFQIEREKGNLSIALENLIKAYKGSMKNDLLNESSMFSRELYLFYKDQDKLDSAYLYLEKHMDLKDSLSSQSSKQQLIQMVQQAKMDSLSIESKLVEAKLKADKEYLGLEVSKKNSIMTLIGFLLVSVIISILLLIVSYKRKKQLMQIELTQKENTITTKNKELLGANLELATQAEAMQKLKLTIEGKLSKEYDSEFNDLSILLKQTDRVLNEKDRRKYISELIKSSSNAFNQNLSSNFPKLTEDEIKLAALIRLNLTAEELLDIFNISKASLNTKRYRMRKKLSLSPEDSLEKFVRSYQ
jgi:tetratricopeptide (TPR) repeat protein